jgi:GNAT superfamily N-acetyltransferase
MRGETWRYLAERRRTVLTATLMSSGRQLELALTPELRREGLARELVHHVQSLRKSTGLEVTDRIALGVAVGASLIGRAYDVFGNYNIALMAVSTTIFLLSFVVPRSKQGPGVYRVTVKVLGRSGDGLHTQFSFVHD